MIEKEELDKMEDLLQSLEQILRFSPVTVFVCANVGIAFYRILCNYRIGEWGQTADRERDELNLRVSSKYDWGDKL